jgi:predicted nucleic acid-binding protein
LGWVDDLHGRVVGLDTMVFIYYIEDRPPYAEALNPFFQAVDDRHIEAITSVITLTEVLVRPIRLKNDLLVARYRELLSSGRGLSVLSPSERIAEEAAILRANHAFRTPDALQIATAVLSGAAAFLTNDFRLRGVPSLPLLLLDELIQSRG